MRLTLVTEETRIPFKGALGLLVRERMRCGADCTLRRTLGNFPRIAPGTKTIRRGAAGAGGARWRQENWRGKLEGGIAAGNSDKRRWFIASNFAGEEGLNSRFVALDVQIGKADDQTPTLWVL